MTWRTRPPTFSIVMPVHDPDMRDLCRAVESVRRQTWPHVELCLVDDGSRRPEVVSYLSDVSKESGLRFRGHGSPHGIAGATNAALDLATAEFAVFLDHDDELAPDALGRVADVLRAHPDADFVYSDHDVIDSDGRRLQVSFKPDWSPELLLSYMYVGHVKVARLELARALGGFREGFDGAADYDFLLRLAERTDRIHHVPEVLYHWRAAPRSMARRADTKTQAFESGRRAVQESLDRRDIAADAEWPAWAQRARLGVYRCRFRGPEPWPSVAILIPMRDRIDLLRNCIASIEERTDYEDWQIVILDNDSRERETHEYLRSTPHRVVRVPGEFNFSRIVNRGVESVNSDLVVLLNNDTIVVSRDWLRELSGAAALPGVGAVGAKLLYPDGRIQHAGVTLGIHGLTGHAFDGHPDRFTPLETGYFAHVLRDVSAVTAACLVARRDIYLGAGGFDEPDLGVAWNDTDFCLRLQEAGYRVVVNPYAELLHLGSASRGDAKNDHEVAVMFDRWNARIEQDPYYNPNWSRLETDFRVRTRVDERRFFHYTKAGFRSSPSGIAGGHMETLPAEKEPIGALMEICRAQELMMDQMAAERQRVEYADRLIRLVASRPAAAWIRRSKLADRAWMLAKKVRHTRTGGRILRRLGLVS